MANNEKIESLFLNPTILKDEVSFVKICYGGNLVSDLNFKYIPERRSKIFPWVIKKQILIFPELEWEFKGSEVDDIINNKEINLEFISGYFKKEKSGKLSFYSNPHIILFFRNGKEPELLRMSIDKIKELEILILNNYNYINIEK